MKIHEYKTKSGRKVITEYINSLPDKEASDGLSVLKSMQMNQMDKVAYKRWQGKIYEVYFYKHNRIFYVVVDGENLYLLHACRKQKNKTERKDRNLVIKRVKEIGKIFGKSFI